MQWDVWMVDGSRWDSSRHTWEDVPERGVLVVRVWDHPTRGDLVLWGDAYYGRPDTLKMEGRVSDDEFARALEDAQQTLVAPGARG
jgi:hypothetical protein